MSALKDDIVVRVEGLSKMFKVYHRPADLMKEVLTGKSHHDPYWALKDVSFALRRGEIMGVVGSNGAGKSTLLKLIAGTLDNTAGTVEVRGRVSAILELGTSFNAERTGRENVRLALTYAGLKGREIDDKMDWIIAFSELGPVMDNPFRTYSSGMQARLTFSTAVASMEDLLIIDEALAAGDAAFVNKAMRYMEDLCRRENVSAIIVSHSMASLIRLCDRGIYLRQGEVVRAGTIEDVAREYETVMLAYDEGLLHAFRQGHSGNATGNETSPGRNAGNFRLEKVALRVNGADAEMLEIGAPGEIVVHYRSGRDLDDVALGLLVYGLSSGAYVTNIANVNARRGDMSRAEHDRVDIREGEGTISFKLNPTLFGPGGYFFHFWLHEAENLRKMDMDLDRAFFTEFHAGQFRVKMPGAFSFENNMLAVYPHGVEAEHPGGNASGDRHER